MARVRLPISLQRYAGGIRTVELSCATVAECLAGLENRFPALAKAMKDDEGRLHSSVKLYINGEDIRYRSSLDTPLQERDELTIMMLVAGGIAES